MAAYNPDRLLWIY